MTSSLVLLYGNGLIAQITGSIPWQKAPIITNPMSIDWDATYSFAHPALKKKGNIKLLTNPLELRTERLKIQIYSVRAGGCDECMLYWKDENGDGQVQPRKEIRSVCKTGVTICKLKGQKG